MHLLEVSGVSKRSVRGRVLQDISFTQEPFRNIAIAGATGSGKTTLLKIIGGLGQADEGKVLFENTTVLGIDEKLMPGHKGIAYLSQEFELPNFYTVENILNYENRLPESDAR